MTPRVSVKFWTFNPSQSVVGKTPRCQCSCHGLDSWKCQTYRKMRIFAIFFNPAIWRLYFGSEKRRNKLYYDFDFDWESRDERQLCSRVFSIYLPCIWHRPAHDIPGHTGVHAGVRGGDTADLMDIRNTGVRGAPDQDLGENIIWIS